MKLCTAIFNLVFFFVTCVLAVQGAGLAQASQELKTSDNCKSELDKILKNDSTHVLRNSVNDLCGEKEVNLEGKVISQEDLEKLFLDKEVTKILPTRIWLKGGVVKEKIELISEDISKEITFDDFHFQDSVELTNATFNKSLSLVNSKFDHGLKLKGAKIKGNLTLDNSRFGTGMIDPPKKQAGSLKKKDCNSFVNMENIQVDYNISFENTFFRCPYDNYDRSIDKEISIVNLRAATVNISIKLEKMFRDANQENLMIRLTASNVKDAIFIDPSTNFDRSKNWIHKFLYAEAIRNFDLSNLQANALVIYLNKKELNPLKNDSIFNLFEDNFWINLISFNHNDFSLRVGNNLSQLKINLENSTIKTFSLLEESDELGSDARNNASELRQNNLLTDKCLFSLQEFNYNQVNTEAYRFMILCLDSLFYSKDNSEQQFAELSQSLENLSVIARKKGSHDMEQTLKYTIKKIEYKSFQQQFISGLKALIGKNDNSNNETNTWTLPRKLFRLIFQFFNLVILQFQEIFYGFGFKRVNILEIFLILVIINFLIALTLIHQKQQEIAFNSLYLRTREIEDEGLETIMLDEQGKLISLNLSDIKQELDLVYKVIFEHYDAPEKSFYVYLQWRNPQDTNIDIYKRVKLENGELCYLINILEQRNTHHIKVGFCYDYYPKAGWSVVTEPKSLPGDSPCNYSCLSSIDLYLITKNTFVRNIRFVEVLPIPEMAESLFKMFFMAQNFYLKFMSWTITAVVFLFLFEIVSFLFIVISLLMIYLYLKKLNLSFVCKKNLENALVFCIDVLIPFIEIDKANLEFVLKSTEDWRAVHLYFQAEKLLGPIILSILLPLFLVTGL